MTTTIKNKSTLTNGKTTTRKNKKTYTTKDYNSNDGMITTVWGPALWHYLHTMSFNYPIHPTVEEKKNYRNFTNRHFSMVMQYIR